MHGHVYSRHALGPLGPGYVAGYVTGGSPGMKFVTLDEVVKLDKKEVKEQGLDIRPIDDEVWTHIRVHPDTDLSKLLSVVKQAYEVNEQ